MNTRPRKTALKAILIADMVEYSLRVSAHEASTLSFVERCFEVFHEHCAGLDATVVKTMGDGIMIEFSSVSEAIQYGLDIQSKIEQLQGAEINKAQFRLGIHAGEVERIGSDIYGHAVNVAARLVALAKPGGICVSNDVYQQARHNTSFGFLSGGVVRLKNIPEPIAIFHVTPTQQSAAQSTISLTLNTIGAVTVEDKAGRKADLRSEHIRALLGYLALSPGHVDYRERLAVLLWSERDAQSARRAFAQCLRSTAAAFRGLTSSPLLHEGDQVALDNVHVTVDVEGISERVGLGIIDSLLVERPDWPETLLRGTDTLAPLYQSWLKVARHNWRAKIADALESCLARFEPSEPALRKASAALLALEPGHEIAAQKLILHYAYHDNVAMAAKTFRDFSSYIADQFQISPSLKTTSLIRDITERRWERRAEATPFKRGNRAPILEVGEIDTTPLPDKSVHLATGFRSELLANLARFREWIVHESLTRSSSSENVGTDYLLSLSSVSTKAGVSILLKLINRSNQHVVWSETIDISVESWFDTLRLVIRQVAARLEIYFSSDRLLRVVGNDNAALASYDAWLRAERLLSMWTGQAEDEAESVLRKVVKDDPQFAPALASLASIHNVRHLIRPGLPQDAHKERYALQLAKQAAEIDPLDARNHLVVAWSSAMAGEFDKAAIHYELAVSLNPVHPKLLISAAQGLAFLGDGARAIQLLEDAIRSAPFLLPYQWCYVCSTCWMTGDYERAVTAAGRGEMTTVDTPGWLAASLSRLGRIDEARTAFREQIAAAGRIWVGEQPVSPKIVLAWFTSSFPIAREEDRALLRESLSLLM